MKPLLYALLVITLVLPLAAQNVNPFDYVYRQTTFDEAAATRQLEAGTSSIRGTVFAKDSKALVKAFNLSKNRAAYKGTIVTLIPYSTYLAEWLALQTKVQKKASLQKAALSHEASSYRIQTKVIDEKGNFEFRDLKPGKYYLYAEVLFMKAGTILHQTGSIDTVHAASGQILASTPTYTGEGYAVDVTKATSTIVEITGEGQVVVAKVTGQ